MSGKLTYIYSGIQLLTMMFLFWITLLPVEARWAEGDVMVMQLCVAACGIGLLTLVHGTKPRFTLTDILVLLWTTYYIGREYIGGEYACATEWLKAISLCVLYYSLRVLFHDTRLSACWLVIGITLCGCYESLMGLQQIMCGTSRHPVFAITGTFQNPGPYSAYLMLALVVGTVVWQKCKDLQLDSECPKFLPEGVKDKLAKVKIGHLIILVLLPLCVILPATWSRAAFVSLATIMMWILRNSYWRYRYAVWGICILAAIALYVIKQGSADGRFIIWNAAITTWSETPWFGVGAGGFRHAVGEGISILHQQCTDLSGAGVTDYAYNIIVKTIVEQGIMGLLIAVTLGITALTKLRHTSRPLFYGMISLVIFSMFSYPFDLLPYKVILILTIAWSESVGKEMQYKIGRMKVILVMCIVLLNSWYIYGKVNDRYEADSSYSLFRGLKDEVFIKDYYELLPLENDNPEFLFDFGKILREQGRYNDSNAALYKGTRCSADPMFYVIIGNNYRDMSQYELAEESYYKAFSIMPNRIYPLFQLMMMYKDNDEIKKTEEMAKRLLSFKPKIESPATQEMKQIAIEIMHDKRGSRKSSIE